MMVKHTIENPLYQEVQNLRQLHLKQIAELEAFRQKIKTELDSPRWNDDERRSFRVVLSWFNGKKATWK